MPYQYIWNTGNTTTTINGLSAGNYSVSVKDSWGCLATNTVNLIQPNAIIASVTSFPLQLVIATAMEKHLHKQ